MGADCKSAGFAYEGSNPSRPTGTSRFQRVCSLGLATLSCEFQRDKFFASAHNPLAERVVSVCAFGICAQTRGFCPTNRWATASDWYRPTPNDRPRRPPKRKPEAHTLESVGQKPRVWAAGLHQFAPFLGAEAADAFFRRRMRREQVRHCHFAIRQRVHDVVARLGWRHLRHDLHRVAVQLLER